MAYDYPDWYLAMSAEEREAHDRRERAEHRAKAVADGTHKVPNGKDLDVIVQFIELACCSLDDEFTFDELMAKIREYATDEQFPEDSVMILEKDVRIVVPGLPKVLKKTRGGKYRLA